jgi:hypothetical protein
MSIPSGAVPVKLVGVHDDRRYDPSEIDDICGADVRCDESVAGDQLPSVNGTPRVIESQLSDEQFQALFEATLNDKGHRLWHGMITDYNNDHSRADLALCILLAQAATGDVGRIDRMFRRSGLYQNPGRPKKWNEPHAADGRTYGQMTIAKAIACWHDQQVGSGSDDTSKQFPVDALPLAIRQFSVEASLALPVPVEAVAVPALVAAASAIGATRNIILKPGWVELSALYGAVVLPSGSIKSPALELALRPVRSRQAEYRRIYRSQYEAYKKELEEYIEARRSRKQDGERRQKPEPPVMRRTFTSDTTTERCGVLLNENPRGLLLCRDELSGWVRSLNQYKAGKGADKEFYLSAYSGQLICVDRQGKDPIYVESPRLSVIGGIPPDVVPELDDHGREDGFLPRILYACPDPVPVRWTDATISDAALTAYNALFDRLYDLTCDEFNRPVSLGLTPDALAIFKQFHDEHCAEAETDTLTPGLRPFYAKLKGLCGRLALIHAVCVDPSAGEVGPESVAAAADLIDYFKGQARRVSAVFRDFIRRTPLERAERQILKNLGGQAIRTRRELFQLGNAVAPVFNEALEALIKVGRVREVTKPGKRKPRKAFALVQDEADEPYG